MKFNIRRILPMGSFMALYILLSWIYGYHTLLHKGPLSIHQWRQADCASLALQYHQNGMDFFKPATQNLMAFDGGAVSEFPLFYYLTAGYYGIFGFDHSILRIISWICFGLGLWGLFRISQKITDSLFWSIWLSAMIMASPLLVYYNFNFICDIQALGLMFWAWWLGYRYYESRKTTQFYQAVVVVTLAGLLKPSVLISYVVVLCIFILERLLVVLRKTNKPPLFEKPLCYLPGFIIVPLAELLWISWVWKYNQAHRCELFWPGTYPIWEADWADIKITLQWIWQHWLGVYYHPSVHVLIMGLSLYLLFRIRKLSFAGRSIFMLMAAGIIAYGMLWFTVFYVHDYYIIVCMVYPAAILLLALSQIPTKILKSPIVKVVAIGFVVFNVYQANREIKWRYHPSHPDMQYLPTATLVPEIRDFFRKNDITPADRVVSIYDPIPNASLYYYQLRGVTVNSRRNVLLDSAYMRQYVQEGFSYLIDNRKSPELTTELYDYMRYPVDSFRHTIFVYDLRPYRNQTNQ